MSNREEKAYTLSMILLLYILYSFIVSIHFVSSFQRVSTSTALFSVRHTRSIDIYSPIHPRSSVTTLFYVNEDNNNDSGDTYKCVNETESSSASAINVNRHNYIIESERNKYKYKKYYRKDSKRKPVDNDFKIFTSILRYFSRRASSCIDGTVPGDYGFDLLGIASTKARLNRLREIEIKHSRIAMLAAIGWPMSEKYHASIMSLVGLPSLLSDNGMVPTVLNKGLLSGPNAVGMGLFIFIFSIIEYFSFNHRIRKEMSLMKQKQLPREPGDFSFDPLNLFEIRGVSPMAKNEMRCQEINHGRVSMIVIVAYVVFEAITDRPILNSLIDWNHITIFGTKINI